MSVYDLTGGLSCSLCRGLTGSGSPCRQAGPAAGASSGWLLGARLSGRVGRWRRRRRHLARQPIAERPPAGHQTRLSRVGQPRPQTSAASGAGAPLRTSARPQIRYVPLTGRRLLPGRRLTIGTYGTPRMSLKPCSSMPGFGIIGLEENTIMLVGGLYQ